MKRILILLLLIGLFPCRGLAQDFNATKLDSFFNVLEKNDKFMGSVAVSKNGNLLYSQSVGYLDAEDSIKADKHTKYRIGSVSKTFTAVLVLKAVEQDELELTQTLDEFYPSIANAEDITIKQLLQHRSGIPNFTDDEDYLSWHTEPKTEDEMLVIIEKDSSNFEPGSDYEYSNTNYVLLSYILEDVFETSYKKLLQDSIAKPLHLEDTYLGGAVHPEKDEAYSYAFTGSWNMRPETDMSIPLGAGGIVSTPTDLVKFGEALFSGKLLTPNRLEQMKTLKEGYGMGIMKIPFYNKRGYGHNGRIDGFSSDFAHFSKDDITYALMSNGTAYDNNDISIAVLSAVYDISYDIPEFKNVELGSEDLKAYTGVYSSQESPLEITISREDSTLIGQATGQSSFPLVPTSENTFEYKQAGLTLEFNPQDSTMVLHQSGQNIKFSRE